MQRIAIGGMAVMVLVTIVMLDVIVAKFARETPALPHALAELLSRGSVIPFVFLGTLLYAVVEMTRMFRFKQTEPFAKFAALMVLLLTVSPWLSAAGWLGGTAAAVEGLFWQLAWLAIGFVGTLFITLQRGRTDGSLRDAAATMLMIVYLGFLPSFAIQIRCGRNMAEQDGAWLLLMVLLIIKASDIGGYLFGSGFGRHKLMPSISPGKSIEGAIGGLLLSAALAVGLTSNAWLMNYVANQLPVLASTSLFSFIESTTRPFSRDNLGIWWYSVFFGAALSISGQLGDLVESCFKRDVGSKNSGNLIPHAGGILDLIDSPITAVPIAWVLLNSIFRV